jgi:hypothetical protein
LSTYPNQGGKEILYKIMQTHTHTHTHTHTIICAESSSIIGRVESANLDPEIDPDSTKILQNLE